MTRYQLAYDEGYSAYLAGETHNPHRWPAIEWSGWADGWGDARRLAAWSEHRLTVG